MTLDLDKLRKLLCERLCEDVRIDQRPDGSVMVHTHFRFPDGDHYPIHLSPAGPGGLRLSDVGGDMISSLNAREDLDRKITQRTAA